MMIQVLIATHGTLAEGLCNASKVIMGPVEGLDYIGLTLDDNIDDFTEKVIDFCDKANDDVLLLTDLQGASPFNASARAISQVQNKKIVCITGVNLPILLECLIKRETTDVEDLADQLIDAGKSGINKLSLSMYQ